MMMIVFIQNLIAIDRRSYDRVWLRMLGSTLTQRICKKVAEELDAVIKPEWVSVAWL